MKNAIEQYKIPYPCALVTDDILRSIPNFRGFPTTLFFGRDGTPREILVGLQSLERIEGIVKSLLEEEPSKPAKTSGDSGN